MTGPRAGAPDCRPGGRVTQGPGGETTRPGMSPGPRLSLGRSTSGPGPPRAHGTAGAPLAKEQLEPRPAGLIQANCSLARGAPIAVLEQPSPGRMADRTRG